MKHFLIFVILFLFYCQMPRAQVVCKENGRGLSDTWINRMKCHLGQKEIYKEEYSFAYETYVWNQTSYMLKYDIPWINSNFHISSVSIHRALNAPKFSLGFNYMYGNRHPYDYSLEYPRSFTLGVKYMTRNFDLGLYVGPVMLPTDVVIGSLLKSHGRINNLKFMIEIRVDDITTKRERFLDAYPGYIESIHNAFLRGHTGYQIKNFLVGLGFNANTNHTSRVSTFFGPEIGYSLRYQKKKNAVNAEFILGMKTAYDGLHIDKTRDRGFFEQAYIDASFRIKFQNLH